MKGVEVEAKGGENFFFVEAMALAILLVLHFFALTRGWLLYDEFFSIHACTYAFSSFFVAHLDCGLLRFLN